MEDKILKLVLIHTKRQWDTKLTLFWKGLWFSRKVRSDFKTLLLLHWTHWNPVWPARPCLLTCHLHLHVQNTLMVGWPAWAFGTHFYCFNINYTVPSPLLLIMGGKQCWLSTLSREKAKGDREKYQMSKNDMNHKAQFLLVNTTAPPPPALTVPLWCGSPHSNAQVRTWGLSHCRMF